MLAASSEGYVFSLEGQTLISIGIQLLNACILAGALAFFLYKPVRKFLNDRAEGIKAQLDGAESSQAQAGELKELYESKLAVLEAERIGVLESARALAAEKSKQLLLDAEKEAAALKSQAMADIQGRRERADEELRLYIIDTAAALAEKFVSRAIDADDQNRLFNETVAALEKLF